MADQIRQLSIKRITSVDENFVQQINPLLDEGKEWNIEQGKLFLTNPDNILLLAFVGDTAAGFLTAYRLQRFDNKKAEILLYEIGVDEQFQRRGIGKALMLEVKDWGQQVDAHEVWVLTNKSNSAAVALYQSAGGVTENPDDTMYVFKL